MPRANRRRISRKRRRSYKRIEILRSKWANMRKQAVGEYQKLSARIVNTENIIHNNLKMGKPFSPTEFNLLEAEVEQISRQTGKFMGKIQPYAYEEVSMEPFDMIHELKNFGMLLIDSVILYNTKFQDSRLMKAFGLR